MVQFIYRKTIRLYLHFILIQSHSDYYKENKQNKQQHSYQIGATIIKVT